MGWVNWRFFRVSQFVEGFKFKVLQITEYIVYIYTIIYVYYCCIYI